MPTRNSLYYRSRPMAIDVKDAITAIITRDEHGLPLAIERDDVAKELVRIANTNEDGEVVPLSASTEKLVEENFKHLLATSGVFQAGYKKYEQEEPRNQVVPVTEFFFKIAYDEDDRNCLNNLAEFEIEQSLPRRPRTQPTDENDNPLQVDGETVMLVSGKIAGVVIYPHGIEANLVTAWLRRLTAFLIGSPADPDRRKPEKLGATRLVMRRIENAQPPQVPAVEQLKQLTDTYASETRAVLPKQK